MAKNAFLAKMKAEAEAKARAKEANNTSLHVQIDTMAMLLAAHDELKVGPGRAPSLVNSYLSWKLEIADDIDKELREDLSKKKHLLVLQRNLAWQLQRILGTEGWRTYRTLFPFLADYWEVDLHG